VSTQETWDRHAATEPYFAVLTEGKYLRANFDAKSEAEFFATGESYVTRSIEVVRQHVTPLFDPHSILEFGCGPGRVAVPLARHFPDAEVVATDVSPAMRELARRNAERLGVTNVTFQSQEELLGGTAGFDLINASLVFHHIAPSEGIPLLRRLMGHLADRGVGIVSFTYHRATRPAIALARWIRRTAPGANRAANLLLRKPAAMPFLHPYLYDLSTVLATLNDAGCRETHLVTERQGDVDVATIYVRKRAEHATGRTAPEPRRREIPTAAPARDFIDVRQLIANASIEELNRTAEEYFAGLKSWEHHLSKPFANAGDTPTLLINLAVLLEGLRLYPGLTILEFGAGTGWLSRILTQLSCQAILTDVSATALKIAEELYRRLPIIGDRPEPRFVRFDGHRIDVPDASVDRIVTFDAFHHVTNPDAVLAEFARILRPGGIAAFAEPGPHHSKTPQSQSEMRTYGVVENDVDIHALWTTAQTLGFTDLKLAAFNARPFHISLDQYEDLLQAGDTYLRWANWTREFMGNVRNFYLYKEGTEPLDSRRVESLSGRITVTLSGRTVHAQLENTGASTWLPGTERPGGVGLGCHLFAADGTLRDFEFHREPLPSRVGPGESVSLTYELPAVEAGSVLEFDLVADGVTWFAQIGTMAARVQV
jgi:ubiquinone/menaquinone biosynthesis C-methylase UbiE